MPRKPTQRQLYEELASRYGRTIADAFLSAIDDLTTAAEIQRAADAIQAGDFGALLEALHLDPAAYNPVLDAIAQTYGQGGQTAASTLPARTPNGASLVFRFNVRNPAAEAWLRDHSATLVTRVLDDQKAAIRASLESAVAAGTNPRQAALDIVGRVNRATGKREGGIIGLTASQEEYARTAADELASGDVGLMRNYLDRARRDKRFDRSVMKAIDAGQPLDPDLAGRAVQSYRNRLLKLRGDVLGQNEAFTAISAARDENYRQAVEGGAVDAGTVTKTWRHFPNEHPRLQHIAMNGKTVPFGQPFILPDGTVMQYPHDPKAPARHTLGCHCQADYRIDFLANVD